MRGTSGTQMISAEAGALDGLAEVFTGNFDLDAHLSEARSHSIANAVAEGLLAGGTLGATEASAGSGLVRVIRRNDGGLLVVVASVEDEGDGVLDPLVGLLRAKVVEDENLC